MNINPLIIPSDIFTDMLAHCRAGCPNEACGILAGKGNEISKIYKLTNIEKSPVSYFMDSKEQFEVMKDMRDNNLSMLAIFHSHPSSGAYPSAKDVSLAFYDDCVYIIVSLIEKEPVVKAFSIKEGSIEEISLTVK
ncbi:MAG: M67 family metallopeptidase [Nitrospirae bacterium]|nr:M67 family metallopeptidase [Nitrospirota bacterium]MCL5977363.1 M67 family metallopeptidase [Nitrospirota bacterium]